MSSISTFLFDALLNFLLLKSAQSQFAPSRMSEEYKRHARMADFMRNYPTERINQATEYHIVSEVCMSEGQMSMTNFPTGTVKHIVLYLLRACVQH